MPKPAALALLLAAALCLAGCAEPPQRVEGTGQIVIVPALSDYCIRNMMHKECGGTE